MQTQSVTLSRSQLNNTDICDSPHLDLNTSENMWRNAALCMLRDTIKPSASDQGRAVTPPAESDLCNMGTKCNEEVLEMWPGGGLGRRKVSELNISPDVRGTM